MRKIRHKERGRFSHGSTTGSRTYRRKPVHLISYLARVCPKSLLGNQRRFERDWKNRLLRRLPFVLQPSWTGPCFPWANVFKLKVA